MAPSSYTGVIAHSSSTAGHTITPQTSGCPPSTPGPQLRDPQLDLPNPRIPPPLPITVALSVARLRRPFAELRSRELSHLELHDVPDH